MHHGLPWHLQSDQCRVGEWVFGVGFIEVFQIDAEPPGPILHWYHGQIGKPIRVFYISDEPGLQ